MTTIYVTVENAKDYALAERIGPYVAWLARVRIALVKL